MSEYKEHDSVEYNKDNISVSGSEAGGKLSVCGNAGSGKENDGGSEAGGKLSVCGNAGSGKENDSGSVAEGKLNVSGPIASVTRGAFIAALLLVSQIALASIPNTELVSFLIIVFTLRYGAGMFAVVEAFAFLEIFVYGLGLWNVIYLYIWAILVAAVLLMKKAGLTSKYMLAALSGLFGLLFGSFCTIVYIFIDPAYALTWWLAGLTFDLWHGICNFVIMILCFTPVQKVIARIG